jgi:hypothetical protein
MILLIAMSLLLTGCFETQKTVVIQSGPSSDPGKVSIKSKVFEVGTQVHIENRYAIKFKKVSKNLNGKVIITSSNGDQTFLSAPIRSVINKTSISLRTSDYAGALKIEVKDNGQRISSSIQKLNPSKVNEVNL